MAARKMKISFGLMSLDCRRESAREAEVELKPLCIGQAGHDAHPASPLKQDPSYCTACGPDVEVDRATLVRGHGSGTTWTVLTAEQVAALAVSKTEFSEHTSLKLVAHPAGEFLGATETGESVYYVTPEPADVDHYALLVRLIDQHSELAFTGLLSLSNGGKAKLFWLRTREGVLVLEQRTREQSMKPTPAVEGSVNEKLLAMMEGALEAFVEPYSADDYEDRYATAVSQALGAGVDTETGTPVAKSSDEDLMTKLAALASTKG